MNSPPADEASIFNHARKLQSPADLERYLSQTCGEDTALRERIEKLLAHYSEKSQFLEEPAAGLNPTVISGSEGNSASALRAGLSLAFEGDAAVVIGDANHSVLRSLGNTLDEVPKVALRDPDAEGHEPISRPNSPEVPGQGDSRYQLQGEIARGGMGAIIKGRDTDLGRDLAIKVLLDAHKDKPDVVQRFIEEAQIGGQLQHPGIAPVYELGQFADKRPFFSMKLVKGQTLSKLLADRDDGSEDRGRYIGIFEQVCQTMAYAHARSVIHRDLKPANIMVGAFGEVQVMDWGLAKVLSMGGVADEKHSRDQSMGQSIIQTLRSTGSDSPGVVGSAGSETQMGSVMGTPAYMPPEQALGEIDVMDKRADVFGLGAILCEILTGSPPYIGDDATQIFRAASRGKLSPCFERLDCCGADEDLVALAKHCLELEPSDRPSDAGALAERVSAYLELVETKLRTTEVERAAAAARADAETERARAESRRAEAESQRAESEAARATAESERASEEHKRRRTSLALAASVLLLLGTGGGGWIWNVRQEGIRREQEFQIERQHAVALAVERDAQEALRIAAEQEREAAVLAKKAAESAQRQAELAREETQLRLYVANIRAGHTAAVSGDTVRLRRVLERLRPTLNETDQRSYEWYFLQSQLKSPRAVLVGDNNRVEAVAIHPDGKWIASGDGGVIRIWDAESERLVSIIENGSGFLRSLEWSPDGTRLLCGQPQAVSIFAAGTWQIVGELPIHMSKAYWSPSGDEILTCSAFGVSIWDSASSEKVSSIPLVGFDANWSRDGRRLAVGNVDSVQVWDLEEQRVTDHYKGLKFAQTIAWSEQGDRLAVGQGDGKILVFAPGVPEPIRQLQGHDTWSFVSSLCWSPTDPHHLLSAGSDGKLVIWNSKTWSPAHTFSSGASGLFAADWSQDGKMIATGASDSAIRLWDAPQQAKHVADTHKQSIRKLAWRSDGTMVATAGDDGDVKVWSPAGELLMTLKHATKDAVYAVAFSPGGETLATGGADDRICLWDSSTGELLNQFDCSEPISQLVWHPNGKLIISAGWNGKFVRVWGTQSTEPMHKLELRYSGTSSLAVSPDGEYLLAGHGANRPIDVWRTETWSKEHTINFGVAKAHALSFDRSGKRLAVAGGHGNRLAFGTIRTWDWEQLVQTDFTADYELEITGIAGELNALSWSGDGKRIATASPQGARLWNVTIPEGSRVRQADEREVLSFSSSLSQIAFDPIGVRLAISDDNALEVWDASSAFRQHSPQTLVSSTNTQFPNEGATAGDHLLHGEIAVRQGDWDSADIHYQRYYDSDQHRRFVIAGLWLSGHFEGRLDEVSEPEILGDRFHPEQVCKTKTGDERIWRWHRANGASFINFGDLMGYRRNHAAYAMYRVHASEEQEIGVLMGDDDRHRVWVNGEAVHDDRVDGVAVRKEFSFPITLQKGWNSVLVKVVDHVANVGVVPIHGFYLRFSDDPIDLASSFEKSRQYGAAIRMWSRAISRDPSNRKLILSRAVTHTKNGDGEKADKDFADYIRGREDDALHAEQRAIAWLSVLRTEEGLREYERAVELDPKSMRLRYACAYIHDVHGRITKALDHTERANRLSPNRPYALDLQFALALEQSETSLARDGLKALCDCWRERKDLLTAILLVQSAYLTPWGGETLKAAEEAREWIDELSWAAGEPIQQLAKIGCVYRRGVEESNRAGPKSREYFEAVVSTDVEMASDWYQALMTYVVAMAHSRLANDDDADESLKQADAFFGQLALSSRPRPLREEAWRLVKGEAWENYQQGKELFEAAESIGAVNGAVELLGKALSLAPDFPALRTEVRKLVESRLPHCTRITGADGIRSEWQYRYTTPAAGWATMADSADGWRAGRAPFSRASFGRGISSTFWPHDESTLWLRRVFDVEAAADIQSLLLHAQVRPEFQVWLNGVEIAHKVGATSNQYRPFTCFPAAKNHLKKGKNVLAVRVMGPSTNTNGSVDLELYARGGNTPDLWSAVLESALRQNPNAMELVHELGCQKLRQDQLSDSVPLLRRCNIFSATGTPSHWMHTAPLIALAGSEEEYHAYCEELLKAHAGELNQPYVVNRVLKCCLLRPGSLDTSELNLEAMCAERERRFVYDGWRIQVAGTMALAKLRSGEWEECKRWLETERTEQAIYRAHEGKTYGSATWTLPIRAIVHVQLREDPNWLALAEDAVREARDLIEVQCPRAPGGALDGWSLVKDAGTSTRFGLIMGEVMCREAELAIRAARPR